MISFAYKFSNVHLASSFLLLRKSKEPQMNSTKSRLVKLFRFFATPQEDSLSVFCFFLWHRQYKILQLTFGFWRDRCKKPWWMIFTVRHLLVTFTGMPVCRQIEIIFVTEIDLNTMFFCYSIFDSQSFFAACQLQYAMIAKAIILMLLSGSPQVHFNNTGACI